MEIQKLYQIFMRCGSVTTDSRTIKGGELFFALKGENFDGNEYAIKALEAGAAYAVVNASSEVAGHCSEYFDGAGQSRLVAVEDTLVALQDLARHHRENVLGDSKRLIVIGITGTNGKTTTKELIRAVLSAKYDVLATEGNLNNDIGVPLTLLKLTPETQLAVVEMGASHPDDIAKLVKVSEPDYGIITNVGKAHLQGFGSFEGVQKAKGALYDYVNEYGKAVFVNEDDEVLRSMISQRKGLSIIPYGLDTDGNEILETTADNPYLRLKLASGKVVNTHLVGAYNTANVLAAICIGEYFEVVEDDAISKIEEFVPSNSRSQMVKTEKNTLIVDAYNANPSSMAAALKNFDAMNAALKVVMLGDMRELGEASVKEHENVLQTVLKMDLEKIFLVGAEFNKAIEQAGVNDDRLTWSQTSEELAAKLSASTLTGCTVLVKGSRGIQMEKVLPVL